MVTIIVPPVETNLEEPLVLVETTLEEPLVLVETILVVVVTVVVGAFAVVVVRTVVCADSCRCKYCWR